jgi:hypothetical protein
MFNQSFEKLDKWIEQKEWKGYDPYDIKGEKLFLLLSKWKYSHFLAEKSIDFFPIFLRNLFGVEKAINPKAMGLFTRGYLQAYKKFGSNGYIEKAKECLRWLKDNSNKGYHGMCWGYPFDWQSRIFIPKSTPSSVVTSTVAHAFLDAYELTKNPSYLRSAESCCNFIINDLNVDRKSKNKICFSYTPLDNYHVHNANLLSASSLIRTNKYVNNDEFRQSGLNAINFTIDSQNKNGSWYYWAPPDKLSYKIDNYHTGFVLEALNLCRRYLDSDFNYSIELGKGLDFYAKNLFLENGIAKIEPDSIYPIDIHSCAQGIITFAELADFNKKYHKVSEKVAKWTIENMQDEKGYFYYRKNKILTNLTLSH